MKRSIAICLIIAAAFLAGCGKSDEAATTPEQMNSNEAQAMQAKAGTGKADPNQPNNPNNPNQANIPTATPVASSSDQSAKRAVIRIGSLGVRVADVEKAEKKAQDLVNKMGGYAESTKSSDLAGSHPTLTMTVRIPAQRFDEAMDAFQALGTRLSKTVTGEDVTAQLIDLDVRLRIMREQEQTYEGFMKKAPSQDQMLSMHDKVMELRAQIESIETQRKTLGQLASLSTVELTLEQSAEGAPLEKDPNWARESWAAATSTLRSAAQLAGTAAIWLLVCCPIWLPIVLLGRHLARTAARDRNVTEPAPR